MKFQLSWYDLFLDLTKLNLSKHMNRKNQVWMIGILTCFNLIGLWLELNFDQIRPIEQVVSPNWPIYQAFIINV